ncbi:YueI family protein [Bacillus sp. 2205SS5-2]|uniref:YueI family protein n=1 Tax=Bacillus sp. 2205SS5-2 TaxID=3109031 RepID=UPI003004DD1B
MSKKTVDDYLQDGIYGAKEINPDERRRYLGTLRERVVIALTQSQVRRSGVYPEVEDLMKQNAGAHLYLNGNMNYSYLSDYIKKSNKHSIQYTMVTNKEYNSEYGLVFAHDFAIDKEDIFLSDTPKSVSAPKNQKKMSLFKKLFKKSNE